MLCCVVFGSGLRELKMAEPERHLSGTKCRASASIYILFDRLIDIDDDD